VCVRPDLASGGYRMWGRDDARGSETKPDLPEGRYFPRRDEPRLGDSSGALESNGSPPSGCC